MIILSLQSKLKTLPCHLTGGSGLGLEAAINHTPGVGIEPCAGPRRKALPSKYLAS